MNKKIDIGSALVIFITLFLFVIALFAKGMTHDLLLEAGVFLVSVKLIMMAHKNNAAVVDIRQDIAELKSLLLQRRHSTQAE